MLIKLILRMILGYVRIQVEGYYAERFINICTNRKLLIWNLKRKNVVELCLNIGIKDFKKLSDIARRTNCKVRIINKKGIPFLLYKYKKRKIFAIFLLIIVIMIFISSMYVWNIDIYIQDNESIENIQEDLQKLGLKQGIKKNKIDTDKIINDIRLNRNDIAWIGIDIEGTNVKVKIVKAKEQPEIISNKDYCDIIAKKSGTISKITAQNGTAVVKVGDIVNTGDILIKGIMEGKYTEPRQVHSLGVVEAEIVYSKTKEIYFEQEIYNQTGKKENKYEINFNNKKVKLYKNISKYEFYITEVNQKKIKISKNFYLPISITKRTNLEQTKEVKEYSLEEAIEIATKDLAKDFENELSNKESIIDKNVKTIQKEDSVIVTLVYKVIEEIGEEKRQ